MDRSISQLKRLRNQLAGVGLRKKLLRLSHRFENRGPKSLVNRILLLQFIWAIFIYALVIAVLWFATNLVIENSVRNQGEAWIAKLDELGIPIYATDDSAQLKSAISYLRNFPEISVARYIDVSGKEIVADYIRDDEVIKNFTPLSEEIIQQLGRTDVDQKTLIFDMIGTSRMRVSAPIWIKSIANDGMINYSLDDKTDEKVVTIGYIDIVMDYSKVTRDLNRNLSYASMLIALLMLVAILIMRIMVYWALMPLSRLEEPLTRLANGEIDVTVSSSGDKEIARIGIALNTTINALKERDEALRQMVNHDTLTGLSNRKYFVERLEQEVERIARGGSSAALFFFDLDRFKNINDTYGHAAGDQLLIQIANLLKKRTRENDLAARFGGDEFTLLAYNVSPMKVHEIAQSFIDIMREFTFYEAGDMLKIYFSIGVTIIDDGLRKADEYLKEADAAVHQAKARGRNGFSIFEHSIEASSGESGVGWHDRLKDVLLNNKTVLYYQALIGLKGQQESIHEVLLRLPAVDNKVIPPSAFMSAAERFGLMAEFDSQVIEKAAQVLSELGTSQVIFSLNLSEQFFSKNDIPEFLETVMNAHQVLPEQFIFEISEQQVLRHLDKLRSISSLLSARGFRFAIDDFGAGFGSFKYLRDLKVHFLKIDSSLVEQLVMDRITRVTVRSIVEVAAELNIRTIAKNVSDESCVTVLRELGVDYAQGYHIAAPSHELHKPKLS